MSTSTQKRFLVLYFIPAAVMDDWMKTDPAARKAAEDKMRGEWGQWMVAHSKSIVSADAAGKTKRATASGISDFRNDIIIQSVVEAESHAAAAQMFEGHPHLQIPQSSIEIMELRAMGPM
jgi:hypothetical protein